MLAKYTSPTQSWSIYCKWACLYWFPVQLLYSEVGACIYLSISYFKWTAFNAEVLLNGLVLSACSGTSSQCLADRRGCWRQPLDSFILYQASPPASLSPENTDWHGTPKPQFSPLNFLLLKESWRPLSTLHNPDTMRCRYKTRA